MGAREILAALSEEESEALLERARAPTARVAVLEAAIDRCIDILLSDEPEDVMRVLGNVPADPDPLAAAVGRVIDETIFLADVCTDIDGIATGTRRVVAAVDALRALAPWWPS